MDVHPARGTRAPLAPFPRLTAGKVIAAAERGASRSWCGAAIDFSACDEVPASFIPVAAASGAITVPDLVRARGAGDLTRCETKAVDGVLYAKPTSAGFIMVIR